MTLLSRSESATALSMPVDILIQPATNSEPPKSFGDTLRTAREARHLTLQDVSEKIKLDPKQIQALENENFSELPGAVFVRGFTRQYARLLELDEATLMAHLPPAVQPRVQSTASHLGFVPRSKNNDSKLYRKARLIAYVLAGAALVGGSIFILRDRTLIQSSSSALSQDSAAIKSMLTGNNHTATIPATNAVIVQPSTTTTASPINSTPIETAAVPIDAPLIEVAFDEPCWIEIKDAQGHLLLSQTNLPGSQQSVKGIPPYTVSITNPNAVKLRYKGIPVKLDTPLENGIARFTLK
jgi:cytoskeleton protein RodZ